MALHQEAAGAEPAPPEGRVVVLLENYADHAQLILERLQRVLPDASLIWRTDDQPLDDAAAPQVVVVGLSTDLGAVRERLAELRERRPTAALVLLRGPGDQWSPHQLGGETPAAVLDKRDGLSFLQRLPEVLRELAERSTPASPVEAPPPPSLLSPSGAALPGPPFADEPIGGEQATQLAIGQLLNALNGVLVDLSPLVELFRGRNPADPVVARYVGAVEAELVRARAMAARLGRIASPKGRMPSARPMTLAQLVTLRAPAWRLFAPEGVALDLAAAPTPPVDIVPEALGCALDDVVTVLLRGSCGPCTLRLAVDALVLDAGAAADHASLRPGSFARWTAVLNPGDERRALTAAPQGCRRLDRALAVVKAHGGRLDLSADASGALSGAQILIPARRPRRAAAPLAPPAVLLVDDDPAVRSVGREILSTAGVDVTEATQGEEVLAHYHAGRRFDLVLLDLAMALLDGRSTFERLKAVEPDAAVILVSGSAAPRILAALFDRGLLGFLPKPFGMRQLVEIVDAGLGVRPRAPSRLREAAAG